MNRNEYIKKGMLDYISKNTNIEINDNLNIVKFIKMVNKHKNINSMFKDNKITKYLKTYEVKRYMDLYDPLHLDDKALIESEFTSLIHEIQVNTKNLIKLFEN